MRLQALAAKLIGQELKRNMAHYWREEETFPTMKILEEMDIMKY